MTRQLIFVLLAVVMTAAAARYLITPAVLEALLTAINRIDPLTVVLALALNGALQWLRAWRFAVMTRGTFIMPDTGLVRIAFQLNFFNFVLPMRLGELSYPVQMRRVYGQPLLESTGVLLLARLFDLATLAAILLALVVQLGFVDSALLNAGLATLAVIAGGFPIILGAAGRLVTPLAARLPKVSRHAVALGTALRTLDDHRVQAASIALSLAIWVSYGLMAVLVASALSPAIGIAQGMLGAAAGNVAFALPVNGIAGFGPAQAAWVVAVTETGVPWRDAAVTALGVHAVSLASALLFGGAAMITAWTPVPAHQRHPEE